MTRSKLHLDTDASRKDLHEALRAPGHDVTRTPGENLPLNAPDEIQLLWATAQGRILFTHNIVDFIRLAGNIPYHKGILRAPQNRYTLGLLILLLDRVLCETQAEDFTGQTRRLSDWMR
jgi:hypothetical protein